MVPNRADYCCMLCRRKSATRMPGHHCPGCRTWCQWLGQLHRIQDKRGPTHPVIEARIRRYCERAALVLDLFAGLDGAARPE